MTTVQMCIVFGSKAYIIFTHPPLVRVFNLGSACTAVAAKAATIKSAAADDCSGRDFMVTNYIDGIISDGD